MVMKFIKYTNTVIIMKFQDTTFILAPENRLYEG